MSDVRPLRPFHQKVVFISGASRGIGRALALGFAGEDATLFLTGRDRARLTEVGRLCRQAGSPRVEVGVGDFTRTKDLRRLIDDCTDLVGVPDVLINNAGELGETASLRQVSENDLRRTLEVNVVAAHTLSRYFSVGMSKRGSGVIINVSSGLGRMGAQHFGAYCMSKFALEGLTQVQAEEWRAKGIRVYAVNPGPTRTGMRAAAAPDEDPMTNPPPDHMVEPLLWLASDQAKAYTGVSVNARVFDPRHPEQFIESASLRIANTAMPVELEARA